MNTARLFNIIIKGKSNQSLAGYSNEPFEITSGGTYPNLRIKLESSGDPCIIINTDEPVILWKPSLLGADHLIYSDNANANVTVTNGYGEGLTPTVSNKTRGRFIWAENFKNIKVENCHLNHTSGIELRTYQGNNTASETVKILKTIAENIDGRDMYNQQLGSGYYRQFVQLNNCLDLDSAQIAWNKIINTRGKCCVEDVMNFFLAGGVEGNPILVHDNFIDGSFPVTGNHSGGGIMCDATHNVGTGACTRFVEAYNNYIIRCANYGLGIAGGHDNYYHDNTVVYSGYIDGVAVNGGGNNGIQVFNYNHPVNGRTPASLYYNNRALNNTIGYVNSKTNERQDKYFPTFTEDGVEYEGCEDCSANNISIPGEEAAITTALEDSKLALWEAAVATEGLIIGNY